MGVRDAGRRVERSGNTGNWAGNNSLEVGCNTEGDGRSEKRGSERNRVSIWFGVTHTTRRDMSSDRRSSYAIPLGLQIDYETTMIKLEKDGEGCGTHKAAESYKQPRGRGGRNNKERAAGTGEVNNKVRGRGGGSSDAKPEADRARRGGGSPPRKKGGERRGTGDGTWTVGHYQEDRGFAHWLGCSRESCIPIEWCMKKVGRGL